VDFNEFALLHHNREFRLACHECKAAAFQSFFEKIMQKHDPTFISVKPSGREGDWKCDGFSQASGTVYQCYAPENLKETQTINKIKEDFDGAKTKWGSKMKAWVFVWSADNALSPRIVDTLLQLKTDNSALTIDDWGREALWQITANLSSEDRVDILGVVPSPHAATETSAAEIQTLLNYLAKRDMALPLDNLELTELAEKIKKNKLSEYVSIMIRTALPIAREVETYTRKHPDINHSEIVASHLVDKYKTLTKTTGIDPDMIFGGLVKYVANKQMDQPKYYWAAIGIVTHYFQLCELFER